MKIVYNWIHESPHECDDFDFGGMDLEDVVIFSPFDNLLKGSRTLFLIQSFDNKTNHWNRKYFQTIYWSNGSFSGTTDVPKALRSFD